MWQQQIIKLASVTFHRGEIALRGWVLLYIKSVALIRVFMVIKIALLPICFNPIKISEYLVDRLEMLKIKFELLECLILKLQQWKLRNSGQRVIRITFHFYLQLPPLLFRGLHIPLILSSISYSSFSNYEYSARLC